jgi:hypothetical protein
LREHREELKQQYPDKWVVCIGDKVVLDDTSLKRICRRVWKEFPEEAHGAALDFINSGEDPVEI